MTRFLKTVGVSSVILLQAPCTMLEHGFSMIPNNIIPNPLASITAQLQAMWEDIFTNINPL